MDEWTGIAIGAFVLSSFVSALRIGHWILNADPRAILNAGRWSLLLIAALTLAVLVWLATNGKWSAALMLAAFILPILVHAAPRWRLLLGPFSSLARGAFSISSDHSPGVRAANGFYAPGFIDPELAERSAAILQAYLEQSSHHAGTKPGAITFNTRPINGSAVGFQPKRMSTAEAFDVLGVDTAAGACEIKEAHQRLEAKINEARDILLGE
jgi:hypothetical protein